MRAAWLQRRWWQPQGGAAVALLAPLAALVAAVARARRRRAEQAAAQAPVQRAIPVIVVGNLVVGGAGKTPTVIALVPLLRAWGWQPGIVSRGHGRSDAAAPLLLDAASAPGLTAAAVGDEPLLMHRRTGAPVAVARDRNAAARRLCAAHPEVDLLIADDGLQHHALSRDIELIVFDSRGLGNGRVLPAGPLREPADALWPAGAAVGANAAATAPPHPLRLVLLNGPWPAPPALPLPAPATATWSAERALAGAAALADWRAGRPASLATLHALRGRTVLAAAGIGDPERFFGMLEAEGLAIARRPLADHAPFPPLPWPPGTPDVLVTEKDAVKLAGLDLGATRVWVVTLDFRLAPGLCDALQRRLNPLRARTTRP